MVKVICYGKEETWESRKAAIDFYTEGMIATAGSAESTRYANILSDLMAGKHVCKDYPRTGWY